MSQAPSTSPPPSLQVTGPRSWRDTLVLGLVLLLVGVVYLRAAWLATDGHLSTATPSGYYGPQTEAFAAGQLHLLQLPDPALLALENPYAGFQGVNRPHDMSLYGGKFYIYYGATPIVLLYLPWRLVTGEYLNEYAGNVLLLYGAFAGMAWWLTRLKQRFLRTLPSWWLGLLLSVLAFGTPVFFLVHNTTFYAVPIAGACFCVTWALVCIAHATATTQVNRQTLWLAGASLCWGLAVGARPLAIAGLPVLGVVAGLLWWESRKLYSSPRYRLLCAAIGPALVAGVVIGMYNYARFESPFEFGISYSLGNDDQRAFSLVGPQYLEKNLQLYLLKGADFLRYYPFVFTNLSAFGVIPHYPMFLLAVLFPLLLRHARWRRASWLVPVGAAVAVGTLNLLTLSLFFGGEDRYLVDFLPPLLLAATATSLALLQFTSGWRPARVAVQALVLGLAGFTLFNGFFLAWPRRPGPDGAAHVTRLLNWPTALWERMQGDVHGPLALDVMFPTGRTGQTEPLLTTGHLVGTGDIIRVHYLDEKHIQVGFFHLGAGGPMSEAIPVDYSQPHRIEIFLGSLYPPDEHPGLAGWTANAIQRARRRMEVQINGATVLRGNVSVYPSTPGGVRIGENTLASDVAAPRFTGTVLAQRHLGLDPRYAQAFPSGTGPVRMTVRFPTSIGASHPLITTGVNGAGDVLFVRIEGENVIRFGHDSWNSALFLDEPLQLDLSQDHTLEISMEPLLAADDETISARQRRRLTVLLDGRLIINRVRPFNPATPEQVEFGFNPIGASSAEPMFAGTIRSLERMTELPLPPTETGDGPLRLRVKFPELRSGQVEPLVAVGRTGRADLVYVRYLDESHLQFGVDHWGYGAYESEPVAVDYAISQDLVIWLGGLFPPPEAPEWQGRDPAEATRLQQSMRIDLGGTTVFEPGQASFAAEADTPVDIGSNAIGASSSGPKFSGEILMDHRLHW